MARTSTKTESTTEEAIPTVAGTGKVTTMKIENVITDPSAQARVAPDEAVIAQYVEDMENGDAFPPVVAFGTNRAAYVGDGFLRMEAYRRRNATKVPVELRPGNLTDAIVYSYSANARHGAQRTNADKRNAVIRALESHPSLSDGGIARLCLVSRPFVGGVRLATGGNISTPSERVGADGKTYHVAERPSSKRQTPPAAVDGSEGNEWAGDAPAGVITPGGAVDTIARAAVGEVAARRETPRLAGENADTFDEDVSQDPEAPSDGSWVCGRCGDRVGYGQDHPCDPAVEEVTPGEEVDVARNGPGSAMFAEQTAAGESGYDGPPFTGSADVPASSSAPEQWDGRDLAETADILAQPEPVEPELALEIIDGFATFFAAHPEIEPERLAALVAAPASRVEEYAGMFRFFARFVPAVRLRVSGMQDEAEESEEESNRRLREASDELGRLLEESDPEPVGAGMQQ